MEVLLIILFACINIYTIFRYFRYDYGVFQAPFLAACACIGVFLPQLTTIYNSDYYDSRLLYNLLFVMISCNVAFTVGFELGKGKGLPSKFWDIDLISSKPMFILITSIGLFASFSMRGVWMNELEGSSRSNFILMVNLSNFLELAFIYSLIYLIRLKKGDYIIITIIVLASLLYVENIVLLGRRNLSLRLSLNLLLFYALYNPAFYKYGKMLVLTIFLFGSILSGSIGDVRTSLRTQGTSGGGTTNIKFLDNFGQSFNQTDFSNGMDLGNAALGIDYCYNNIDYDYGLQLWNAFIENFVPRVLVGQELKSSLMFNFDYMKIIPKLTNNITTMTGYFDAFASFSYFGFIKFMLTGFIFGICWRRSYQSSLYLIVYMFLFSQTTSNFTHSSNYIFMRLEFLFVFCFPLLIFHFYQRVRSTKNAYTPIDNR